MASESSAVLFNRMAELGLSELEAQFRAKGWSTQGQVAFVTTYSPNQPDDRLLMEQLINPVAQDKPELHPGLRRLWFECYSMVMVEIKSRTMGSSDAAPRRLTEPELVAKRRSTASRVTDKLEGELDVSDDLINTFNSMIEKKRIVYVPLDKSVKRELGIEGFRSDPYFKKDEKGALVEVAAQEAGKADLSTDLRVELAMQRLGLAADMAGLMS